MTTQPAGYRKAQCCGTCRHSWRTTWETPHFYCAFGAMDPPRHGDAPTLDQWLEFREAAQKWEAQRPQIEIRHVCDFWESDSK